MVLECDDVECVADVACSGREKEWPAYSNHCVACWCCIHRYGNTVDSLCLKQPLRTSLRSWFAIGGA